MAWVLAGISHLDSNLNFLVPVSLNHRLDLPYYCDNLMVLPKKKTFLQYRFFLYLGQACHPTPVWLVVPV